eukprot:maker-scaffold_3-snap-gene-21.7-mRNA-1 protein AED:0.24 eAED:0.24 QI:47/1/1/1/1/1/2/128/368
MNTFLQEQDCACGLTGIDCDILENGLESLDQAMSELCEASGFLKCAISSTFGASCVCSCGFRGEFCEDEKSITNYNYAVGILLPVIMVLFTEALRRWTSKLKYGTNFSELSTTWMCFPLSFLLASRVSSGMFCFFLIFFLLREDSFFFYGELSGWNLLVALFSFIVGSFLSLKQTFPDIKPSYMTTLSIDDDSPAFLYKIYPRFLSILTSSSVVSSILIWYLRYEELKKIGQEDHLFKFSSICMNIILPSLIIFDFLVSRTRFYVAYVVEVIVFSNFYLFFHAIFLMFKKMNEADLCGFYDELDLDNEFYGVKALVFVLAFAMSFLVLMLLSKLKPKEKDDIKQRKKKAIQNMKNNVGHQLAQSGVSV